MAPHPRQHSDLVRTAQELIRAAANLNPDDPAAALKREFLCDTASAMALVALASRFEEVFKP